jgi:hypothetical protein
MKRWEYKVICPTADEWCRWWGGGKHVYSGPEDKDVEKMTAELNRLGSLGWELVSTSERLSKGDTDATLLLFKREVLS